MNVKRVKNVKRARCTRETALHFGLNIEYVFVTLASENKAFLIFFLSTAADLATLGRRSFFFVCLRRLPSYKNPHIQRKTNCNPFRSEIFHIPQFNKISKNAQASLVLKERLRSLETGLWLASTSLSSFHFFFMSDIWFCFLYPGWIFRGSVGKQLIKCWYCCKPLFICFCEVCISRSNTNSGFNSCL